MSSRARLHVAHSRSYCGYDTYRRTLSSRARGKAISSPMRAHNRDGNLFDYGTQAVYIAYGDLRTYYFAVKCTTTLAFGSLICHLISDIVVLELGESGRPVWLPLISVNSIAVVPDVRNVTQIHSIVENKGRNRRLSQAQNDDGMDDRYMLLNAEVAMNPRPLSE